MNAYIKTLLENAFKCRIFRNSLPRCIDLFYDIDKFFGAANFKIIFDIGANVGQSAKKYDEGFPEAIIHSFEPVASTFRTLLANTSGLNRVHAHNLAFGGERGEIHININNDSRVNSIIHNKTGKTETVKVETIDSFLANSQIQVVDFMKIDTEGFELEVLQGGQKALRDHRIGVLSVECEPVKTDQPFVSFGEVAEYLQVFGYELFGIYEQQLCWTGEKSVLFFNPVFICKELVAPSATPKAYPLRRTLGEAK